MQRLNHHHLYVFWIFSKTESFTKAALELSIAQSAVTSQVRQLEESLGVALVDRSNARRPLLTDEGHKIVEYAEDIFETSRELINWATQGALSKKRVVRVGALSGLSRNFQYDFLEPLIGQIGVSFEVTTGDQGNLMAKLQNHELDVVLSSRNAQSDVKFKFHSAVLKSSPLVFVVRNDRKIKNKESIAGILRGRLVYTPGFQFESKPELDAYLEQFKNIQIAGEVDDTALLRVLAVKSGAVVVIPEMGILSEINSKEVLVLGRLGKIEQRYYAITRQRRDPNVDVRYLLESSRS